GLDVFRENSRCSQGTGNFLRQLVGRFSLTVEEAGELCAAVDDPAPLSSRCPVILKTDMTHLANKGVDRERILAGLFDAVCENVLVLLKPGTSPEQVALIGGVTRSPRIRRAFSGFLSERGMSMLALDPDDALYLEALGSAVIAAENPGTVPPLESILAAPAPVVLERLPPLHQFSGLVTRMKPAPEAAARPGPLELVLGFDIGSTGS
ncbi:MAG: BadF/BadG/BcrA/BcrD ATPase family protein, partial [Acidobacteriota bacterium]